MTGPHPTYLAERELIRRAKSGDRDAMGTLMEKWWPLLCRFAIRATGQPSEEAIGIVAFQFIRAVQLFDETKERTLLAYLGPLLPRITHQVWNREKNIIRVPTVFRARQLSQNVQTSAAKAAKVASLDACRPNRGDRPMVDICEAHAADEQPETEEIMKIVSVLPPKVRDVIEFRIGRGMTFRQIAACVGYSTQRAAQLYREGMLMLADHKLTQSQAVRLAKTPKEPRR
jgi:DNA-directed RNA polymerase specialized sigma subunit